MNIIFNPPLQLDCSNKELQLSIIQSAIDRGSSSIASCNASSVAAQSKYYQSSSSSGGESSSDTGIESGSNEIENKMPQPRQMTKQVGGIASHKRPVLAVDRYILKPLRSLLGTKEYILHTTNDHQSKAYRGVREVAFYEALKFTSTLPSDLVESYSKMFQRIANEGKIGADAENWQAMAYLLSLYKNASAGDNNTPTAIQPFYASSFIQSCRFPCIGCHNNSNRQSTKTESMASFQPVNTLPSDLGSFNSMALLAACYAGDHVVLSSVQSYANAWYTLLKEVESLKQLSKFTSPYFGMVDLHSLEQGQSPPGLQKSLQKPHLLLKNLTAPFRRPNIIDIKMGTQTYEPAATASKQMREAAKYPQQSEIGFRIVGMRVWDASVDDYRCWDKSFGVKLKTHEEAREALATFFKCSEDGGDPSYARHVLSSVMEQLAHIKKWFEEENTTLSFYASSILIVYDGSEVNGVDSPMYQAPVLKMIDFAHVCRQAGGDVGYLKGVKSLSSMLDEIKRKLK